MSEMPFGEYPFKPGEKQPMHLTKDKLKPFIYTEAFPESSDLNWLVVSTEHMTVGIYQLAPGSTFDPVDIHAGDEVYYILKGTVTMMNPRLGQVEEVHCGECILMPMGAPHKAYNFTQEEARILFVIAPKIWDDGPTLEFTEVFNIYKAKERRNGYE